MTAPDIDSSTQAETAAALDVARALAAVGVPVFLADPDDSATGYQLPHAWQQTEPDPGVIDRWRPGMALGAVMGRGLDAIDVDPRNGGDPSVMNGHTPRSYGTALTPSGGAHSFIAGLGVAKQGNVWPGIDVQAGAPDGTGRGFVFLPPTVRASKVDGVRRAYRWATPPDLDALRAAWATGDDTGAKLAARIRELRTSGPVTGRPGGWFGAFLDASREPQSQAAAERAVTEKLTDVAEWTSDSGAGFRTVLLRAALTLGGYVGGGWLDEDDARGRLETAAGIVWGAPDDDDRLWIAQGLADGAAQPFWVYTPEDERLYGDAAQAAAHEGEAPPPLSDPDGAGPPEPPWNVFTVLAPGFDPAADGSDQGLAKAAAYWTHPVLRYASDAGTWLKRERDHWEEHTGDLSEWAVGVLAELMPLGETPIPKALEDRSAEHWQAHRRALFTSSAGTGKISRKFRALVRSDHPSSLRIAGLDTNPDVLWAGGVPWDLRASADVPTPAGWIDPATPHLRTAACVPDPTVPTPRWDAFLAAVLPDDELRAWALRVLSISLTGHPDAALPVLYGRERSGKSSLVESLIAVLGSYGHAANPKLLAAGGADGAAGDAALYDLKARRLSFIDEGPKRGHDATERLKQLTGGASMTAARKYGAPVTFEPSHTLVMTTNTEPGLTDPALRARVRLIPCDQPEATVRPARLPLLGAGLRAEAPGILAALMREAAGYLADRDTASLAAAPASIRALSAELAAEQDPVREWLHARTVECELPGTRAGELRRDFADWHQAHPDYRRASVPSPQAFGRALADLEVPREHRRDGWYWARSVITGPSGPGTPPPTIAAFLGAPITSNTNMAAPNENSSRSSVTDVREACRMSDGTFGVSVTADNTRSAPVFASAVTDVTASSKEEEEQENKEREENREVGATRSVTVTDDLCGAPEPSVTCENAAMTDVTDTVTATDTVNHAKPAPLTPRNVSNRAAAARADQDKITKADARKALAAESREQARVAAVAEAGGEVHPLPAVVDRPGHVIPCTPEQARAVVTAALARHCTCSAPGTGHLTVDVETSGYPVGHRLHALRSVQLGDHTAVAILEPVEHAELIRELVAAAPVLHAHSAVADLVPLAHAGLIADVDEAWSRMHDTVIAAKLADPASTGSDPGLKQLAVAVLREHATAPAADEAREALFKAGRWSTGKGEKFVTQLTKPIERNGWAQVPTGSETMIRYAGSDVLDTSAIAVSLPPVPPAILARERQAEAMVSRVGSRGLRIDPERLAELTSEHRRNQATHAAEVRAYGIENPGSDQQVARTLAALGVDLPRTPASKTHPQGQPSVAEHVLSVIRRADPESDPGRLAAEVLAYRHSSTALGLFLSPYAALVEHGDGRMRPTIYTLGADTGRMTSTRTNVQQLPREGGIRSIITADPGHVLISADFSGVELRGAAALSQDPTMMHMIAEEDAGRFDGFHWAVARQAFGPQATKSDRYHAKRGVFGHFYGGSVATIAKQLGITEEEAQRIVDSLKSLAPGMAGWSNSIQRAVRQGHTQFPAYNGRVIHFKRDTPHKAPNYAIQGTCREILVDALIRWADTRWGNATLFPVHDELVIQVPAEDGAAATAELQRAMTSNLYGVEIVAEADEPSFAWQDSA